MEGAAGATARGYLHEVARLCVNYFQLSAKLRSKRCQGARVLKWHDVPATPFSRLLASDSVGAETKRRLQEIFDVLDPLQLLAKVRQAQQRLAALDVGRSQAKHGDNKAQDLDAFLESLKNCRRQSEVRPTHRSVTKGRDGALDRIRFETVWAFVQEWLTEEPTATAKELFQRVQARMPGLFTDGQLRTLQRRMKQWSAQ